LGDALRISGRIDAVRFAFDDLERARKVHLAIQFAVIADLI
jgi:hypothetical protein